MMIERFEKVTSSLQSISALIIAIVALLWFFEQGLDDPWANVDQKVKSVPLTKDWRYLRAEITFENFGATPIKLSKGNAYIEIIRPLVGKVKESISSSDLERQADNTGIVWQTYIGSQNYRSSSTKSYPEKLDLELTNVLIMPKERQTLNIELIIHCNLEVIVFGSHFENRPSTLGWSTETLVNFEDHGDCNDAI
ncbi:hypothetical protein [Marinobacter adhaerens]|uniref:hypothetical protein n=1 Tax=Marinobacter adhaerens TaxID=1033846 RepID=UPI003C4857E8